MIRSARPQDQELVREYNELEKKWKQIDGLQGALPEIKRCWKRMDEIKKELYKQKGGKE